MVVEWKRVNIVYSVSNISVMRKLFFLFFSVSNFFFTDIMYLFKCKKSINEMKNGILHTVYSISFITICINLGKTVICQVFIYLKSLTIIYYNLFSNEICFIFIAKFIVPWRVCFQGGNFTSFWKFTQVIQ